MLSFGMVVQGVQLADGAVGPVEAKTSNGSIGLIVGPGFAGLVYADTSNGSIGIDDETGAAQLEMVRDDRTEKVVRLGGGETESNLGTSNGSVKVTVRE